MKTIANEMHGSQLTAMTILARRSTKPAQLGCIAFIVVLWTYVLPAFAAYKDNAMFASGIRSKLSGAAKVKMDEFDERRRQLNVLISEIDKHTMQAVQSKTEIADIPVLVSARDRYSSELDKVRPPLYIAPFLGDWINEIWLTTYLLLVGLVYLRPASNGPQPWLRVGAWATAGYCAMEGTNWIRNFLLNTLERGRVTYAYVHWDISRSSFIFQELRVWGMMFLVAFICRSWAKTASDIRAQIELQTGEASTREKIASVGQLYRDLFRRWQVTSIMLSVVFVLWTYFYWYQIGFVHDYRYLFSAIALHSVWGIAWYVSSAPLLVIATAWSHMRIEALMNLPIGPEADQVTALKDLLEAVERPTEWQLLGAALAAAITFVLPLINFMK